MFEQAFRNIDPDMIEIDDTCMRDVREIGHWGTGQIEVVVTDDRSLQLALPLIERAYEGR